LVLSAQHHTSTVTTAQLALNVKTVAGGFGGALRAIGALHFGWRGM
jgi:hypothetical protein